MTIKLMLLKSGEDVIADVSEMLMGEEKKERLLDIVWINLVLLE